MTRPPEGRPESRLGSRRVLDLEALRWNDAGLVPVVAQDVATGAVLMLAWADREAVERTLSTGLAWFWSRSRSRLWQKGETSGNVLRVAELAADCDGDTLLYRVDATGPACHRGTRTCFVGGEGAGEGDGEGAGGDEGAALELGWLAGVLAARRGADPAASYTARLLAAGVDRIARKVGEEATEVVIAALRHDAGRQLRQARGERPGASTALLGTAGPAPAASRTGGGIGGAAGGGAGGGTRGAVDGGSSDLEATGAALAGEAADLLYHLLVLLDASGVPPRQVAAELRRRHARPATPSSPKPEDAPAGSAEPEETSPVSPGP